MSHSFVSAMCCMRTKLIVLLSLRLFWIFFFFFFGNFSRIFTYSFGYHLKMILFLCEMYFSFLCFVIGKINAVNINWRVHNDSNWKICQKINLLLYYICCLLTIVTCVLNDVVNFALNTIFILEDNPYGKTKMFLFYVAIKKRKLFFFNCTNYLVL